LETHVRFSFIWHTFFVGFLVGEPVSTPDLTTGGWSAVQPINTISTCNIEFDATVFGSAPNKANSTRCPSPRWAFGRDGAPMRRKGAYGSISMKRPSKKIQVIYRRRCAPNTGKALEIAKEKARAPDRRVTGAKTGKNRAINRTIAPASGGRIPGFYFCRRDNRQTPRQRNRVLCGDLRP
jgi:hypothetical protein